MRIHITIESLECAGAEKSLITFLNLIDYSIHTVDLQLITKGGPLEKMVPAEVNVLPELEYVSKCRTSAGVMLKENLSMSSDRIRYSVLIRHPKANNRRKARYFWQTAAKHIPINQKSYDVAIAYSQGIPTFYAAEKVRSNSKLAWVNVSYELNKKEAQFQRVFYEQMNQVIAVSESAKEIFISNQLMEPEKITVFEDILDAGLIRSLAAEASPKLKGNVKIVTIGRLARQKGYDRLIETAAILKNKQIDFDWYVLGKGPLEREIKEMANEYGVNDKIHFLGVKDNPYPYLRQADVYVQTSSFEGYGIAIAEARTLGIPVVTTPFDAVYQQMRHLENGVISAFEPEKLAEDISKLINNKELRQHISIAQINETSVDGDLKQKVNDLLASKGGFPVEKSSVPVNQYEFRRYGKSIY